MALLREVPASFAECELTHRDREPIDLDLARDQHRGYADALHQAGFFLRWLPSAPLQPDSPFVEDPLFCLGGELYLGWPGADSRSGERDGLQEELLDLDLRLVPEGLRLDGGDLLWVGETLFVGRSSRTSEESIEWLRSVLPGPLREVELRGALHLKTAVSSLPGGEVLLAPSLVDARPFAAYSVIETASDEELAANVLVLPAIRGRQTRLLVSEGFPRTAARLAARGHELLPLPLSEFHKAEGGPTCLSVLLGVDFQIP